MQNKKTFSRLLGICALLAGFLSLSYPASLLTMEVEPPHVVGGEKPQNSRHTVWVEQDRVRDNFRRYQRMPIERRQMLRDRFRDMTPEQRQEAMKKWGGGQGGRPSGPKK